MTKKTFENETELWVKIDEVQAEITKLRESRFDVARRKLRVASCELAKLYKELRVIQVANDKAFEAGQDNE